MGCLIKMQQYRNAAVLLGAIFAFAMTAAGAESSAIAATTAPTVWTLPSFVRQSVDGSDSLQQQRITVEKNGAIERERTAQFLPALSATAEGVTAGGGQNAIINNTIVPTATEQSSWNSKLNLTQNLFNGLQDLKRLRAARASTSQSRATLVETRRAQIESSLRTFFALLADQSDLENEKKEIEFNEKSLGDTRSKIRSGAARPTEAITLESTIASNKIDFATTSADLAQQRETARRLLGADGDVSVDYQPGHFRPAEITKLFRKLDLEARADLRAQKANTEAALQTAGAAKSVMAPKLDLGGSYVMTDSQVNSQKGQYNVAVTLTVPLPFGMEKRAQVEEAAKDYALAEKQEAQKRRDLELDRQQLVRTIEANVEQINRLNEAKELGRKNVQALKKDRAVGLSTYSEVLAASSSYQQIVRKADRALLDFELNCFRALIWSAGEDELATLFGEAR